MRTKVEVLRKLWNELTEEEQVSKIGLRFRAALECAEWFCSKYSLLETEAQGMRAELYYQEVGHDEY